MKFWELFSLAGRSDGRDMILDVSRSNADWRVLGVWVESFDALVAGQDRGKLDCELPDEFCRAVLDRVSQDFYLSADRLGSRRLSAGDRELSALEAFEMFGGSALEETMEFGSYPVGGSR
jgi:hypothetical protein